MYYIDVPFYIGDWDGLRRLCLNCDLDDQERSTMPRSGTGMADEGRERKLDQEAGVGP